MASEVISSALLMIATIIAAVALINAVFPSIYGMSGSITTMTNNVDDRMKSDIKFIYETTDQSNNLTAWIKNTGQTQIIPASFNDTDVFYGDANGVMKRAILNSTSAPGWTYNIENDNGNGRLDPGETLCIHVLSDEPFTPGNYYKIRLVLYNGAFCEDYFTV
jgi:archaeal flagellar protein FlaG